MLIAQLAILISCQSLATFVCYCSYVFQGLLKSLSFISILQRKNPANYIFPVTSVVLWTMDGWTSTGSVSPAVRFELWVGGNHFKTSPFFLGLGRMCLDFMSSRTQATALILGVLFLLCKVVLVVLDFFSVVLQSFGCFRWVVTAQDET